MGRASLALHLPIALAGTLAAASALVLWLQDLRRSRGDDDGAGDPPRYVRGMRERDYLRLIPEGDLLLIKGLLRRVYKARGWANDEESRKNAWSNVLAIAQTPAGGAWQLNFDMDEVNQAQLTALCAAVESAFLGGLMTQHIAGARRRPAIQVVPGEDPRDPYSWLSGLHDDNTILVNANRWRESISEENPMNFEGALCFSKLEALAHALGHELVHAVVLNFFPHMDAASPAYLPDDKHGPIFMMLNKRLFGHVGHASQRLFNVR